MQPLSVLLVDDEQEFVLTLAERLELRGLRVRTAFDGQEALLAVMEEVPQVVVLDMFMPGLSGEDILHALKSRYPHLPIILLTGHAGPVDSEEEGPSLSAAFACLTKPVALQNLWDKLHAAVEASSAGGEKTAGQNSTRHAHEQQ